MASVPSAEPYRYSSLPDGVFIRVLELKPGEIGSNLDVSLHLEALDRHPHYVALSYTWGHPDDCATVTCGGKHIKVPRNLHDALQTIRDDSRPIVLWADSICIDQHSNKEKNHQVALMGKIYQQASRVIVWLGTDKEGCRQFHFRTSSPSRTS